jgi:hypothetical protein
MLFYKKRTYPKILQAAAKQGFPQTQLRDFLVWLPQGRIDQKSTDAAAMLAAIRTHLAAAPSPLHVCYAFAQTAAWEIVRRCAENEMRLVALPRRN